MPTLTITQSYADGSPLTKALLDTAYDSIETFLNTTKIDHDNIQTGGIATANYAASSVDAAALGSDAVTSAKILDGAVTGAKLNANVVDNSTLQLSSSQLKIKDAGVTRAKLAASTHAISSSCGAYSSGSTSFVDITNLSVSMTTTGRPVKLQIVPDGTAYSASGSYSYIENQAYCVFRFMRDAVEVGSICINGQTINSKTPATILCAVDIPSAGTYTYKLQLITSGTPTTIDSVKLFVSECV